MNMQSDVERNYICVIHSKMVDVHEKIEWRFLVFDQKEHTHDKKNIYSYQKKQELRSIVGQHSENSR